MRGSHYRPDIDGLRAIAVLSVVLFHAFPGHLLGGFVGVDVFFVISGFLITGDLHRRATDGTFSISGFYARRVRRIFPALAVVLATGLIAGWFTLSAYAYRRAGIEVAAGAGFVSNIYYWQTLNYFSAEAIENPFLHLWSLGVEEQFYIVWPLIIFAIARWRIPAVTSVLVIAIASYSYALPLTSSDGPAAFFSPLSRFWELSIGGALALSKLSFKPALRQCVSIGGLVGLLGAIVLVREVSFPGYQALLPVVSTAALIAAGPAGLANKLLAQRAMVAVGLISYPLYLWHWPILSFAYITGGYAYGSVFFRGCLVIVAIILAVATFIFVEKRGRLAPPQILFIVIAMIATVGVSVYFAKGWPLRAAAKNPAIALVGKYQEMHQNGLSSAYLEKCDFLAWHVQRVRASISSSCIAGGNGKKWMLWGDSHAQALSLGLRRYKPRDTGFIQVATSACSPNWPRQIKQTIGIAETACNRSNALAVATIQRTRPDVLILSMNNGYLTTDWESFARKALSLGAKKVLLVGPVPEYTPSLPVLFARGLPKQPAWIRSEDEPILTDRALIAQSRQTYKYFSQIKMLCRPNHTCRVSAGDQLMQVDGSHLSPNGSLMVGAAIAREIALTR